MPIAGKPRLGRVSARAYVTISMPESVRVAIAVPLQPELVEPIEAVDPRIEVVYEPDLLPPMRYPNDHRGVDDFRRSPDDERRWWEMIGAAEVLFGIPGDTPKGLAQAIRTSPGLRGFRQPRPAPGSRSARRG